MWTDGPDAVSGAHLDGCLACRAEARRAGDLLAALAGMGARMVAPTEDLEAELIAAATRTRIGRAREVVSHPKFWRGAAVGAAAAAAAATAAFGLIAAKRAARPEVA
jgi:predicted anti-sigma-YlaC factor YlaD